MNGNVTQILKNLKGLGILSVLLGGLFIGVWQFNDRVDARVEGEVKKLETQVISTLQKFQIEQDTRQEKTDLALLQLRINILEEQISRDEHLLRKAQTDEEREFFQRAIQNKRRKLAELERILESLLFPLPTPPARGDSG